MKKEAADENWAVNQSEIDKEVGKKVDVADVAVDPAEAKADSAAPATVSSPKVKKYYNRLPSKSVGAPYEEALDRKSKQIESLNE